jgi:hypothetical protein
MLISRSYEDHKKLFEYTPGLKFSKMSGNHYLCKEINLIKNVVITFYDGSCVSVSSSIVVVEQLTHCPKFGDLNGAAAGIERKRMTEKLGSLMLRHI